MRTVRWLACGLAFIALTPSVGAAQGGRLFRDSWFWGANVGIMNYSTQTETNQTATVFNGEWFITKTKGALYVSVGEALFTATSTVPDNLGNQYAVQVQDMTQVMVDVVALPVAWSGFHLYAGGGFIMNLTHHAEITDVIANPNIKEQVQQNLNNVKDGVQFNILVGVHAQLKRAALFGNIIWMPTPSNFILNGKSAFFLEAGVRFNFGPSAEGY